jgi:hypothetical protein
LGARKRRSRIQWERTKIFKLCENCVRRGSGGRASGFISKPSAEGGRLGVKNRRKLTAPIWPTHRYCSNRALDPPIWGFLGLCNMGGFSCCLLGRFAPQRAATEPSNIVQTQENPISVGQAPASSHSVGSAISVRLLLAGRRQQLDFDRVWDLILTPPVEPDLKEGDQYHVVQLLRGAR